MKTRLFVISQSPIVPAIFYTNFRRGVALDRNFILNLFIYLLGFVWFCLVRFVPLFVLIFFFLNFFYIFSFYCHTSLKEY